MGHHVIAQVFTSYVRIFSHRVEGNCVTVTPIPLKKQSKVTVLPSVSNHGLLLTPPHWGYFDTNSRGRTGGRGDFVAKVPQKMLSLASFASLAERECLAFRTTKRILVRGYHMQYIHACSKTPLDLLTHKICASILCRRSNIARSHVSRRKMRILACVTVHLTHQKTGVFSTCRQWRSMSIFVSPLEMYIV